MYFFKKATFCPKNLHENMSSLRQQDAKKVLQTDKSTRSPCPIAVVTTLVGSDQSLPTYSPLMLRQRRI
jgi:hypothetical protein